jgi:hypothetical protein
MDTDETRMRKSLHRETSSLGRRSVHFKTIRVRSVRIRGPTPNDQRINERSGSNRPLIAPMKHRCGRAFIGRHRRRTPQRSLQTIRVRSVRIRGSTPNEQRINERSGSNRLLMDTDETWMRKSLHRETYSLGRRSVHFKTIRVRSVRIRGSMPNEQRKMRFRKRM